MIDGQATFVYRPRSGDRIFCEAFPDGMPTPVDVQHPNGCRHIIGGAHLWWRTADPGQHWRAAARTITSTLVARYGGFAWDDQGVIHIVTCAPRPCALAMDSAANAHAAPKIDEACKWRLVGDGLATLVSIDEATGEPHIEIRGEWLPSVDLETEDEELALARQLAPKWYTDQAAALAWEVSDHD